MSRSITRESAFRTIYSKLFDEEYDGFEVSDDLNSRVDKDFYDKIVNAFVEHRDELKHLIESSLTGINYDRVYKLDLALIYSALTEIKYIKTSEKIVINETIELAKSYSTEKSAKFINGFLASVLKKDE